MVGSRIVWLDSTNSVPKKMFGGSTCSILQRLSLEVSSSFLFNAEPARPMDQRRKKLAEEVGEWRLPEGTTDESLAKWGWADAQRQILADALTSDLAGRGDGSRLRQLFDFRYADGARMQTYGGVVLIPALERRPIRAGSRTSTSYDRRVNSLSSLRRES